MFYAFSRQNSKISLHITCLFPITVTAATLLTPKKSIFGPPCTINWPDFQDVAFLLLSSVIWCCSGNYETGNVSSALHYFLLHFWEGCLMYLFVCSHVKNYMAKIHQIFVHVDCCLWPWLTIPLVKLQNLMYVWFCGWHVFTQWCLWYIKSIPKSRESVTAEATASTPTKFCLIIKISK